MWAQKKSTCWYVESINNSYRVEVDWDGDTIILGRVQACNEDGDYIDIDPVSDLEWDITEAIYAEAEKSRKYSEAEYKLAEMEL